MKQRSMVEGLFPWLLQLWEIGNCRLVRGFGQACSWPFFLRKHMARDGRCLLRLMSSVWCVKLCTWKWVLNQQLAPSVTPLIFCCSAETSQPALNPVNCDHPSTLWFTFVTDLHCKPCLVRGRQACFLSKRCELAAFFLCFCGGTGYYFLVTPPHHTKLVKPTWKGSCGMCRTCEMF